MTRLGRDGRGIAASLSIEPFEVSRWRLRRTRQRQVCVRIGVLVLPGPGWHALRWLVQRREVKPLGHTDDAVERVEACRAPIVSGEGTHRASGPQGPRGWPGEWVNLRGIRLTLLLLRGADNCWGVNISTTVTTPPQSGHIRDGLGGACRRASRRHVSSKRHKAANRRRQRFAIQPKWRMRTKPRGSTCSRKRRMNSSAVSVILRFLLPCA